MCPFADNTMTPICIQYCFVRASVGWYRHCATRLKFVGSIPDGVIGIIRWHNLFGSTMALRSTLPLTEMSTRYNFWGVKDAGSQAWQPYHLQVQTVWKSGSLNLLERSGPVQGCTGIVLPALLVVCCWVGTGVIQVMFLHWDVHFFRHVRLMLHVSTSSLLFFRWLPCFILYLPSRCTFSLLSTLCRKVKQKGSSENVGFNYWSKGLFPFLFDLYSLPYSSLNNISLPPRREWYTRWCAKLRRAQIQPTTAAHHQPRLNDSMKDLLAESMLLILCLSDELNGSLIYLFIDWLN